ncbi:MAG: (5-formylfuran-3-yl)methyl phosphate synthase [Gemmatimonadota bacterium]
MTPPTREIGAAQLLISVRDAAEARDAVLGGAEIIDAKDPLAGALSPVSPEKLAEIRRAVPQELAVSAALGDAPGAAEIQRLTSLLKPGELWFGKVGLAGHHGDSAARAVAVAAEALAPTRLVLVAYADWPSVHGPAPDEIRKLAIQFGAAGILLDTASKASGNLLHLWSPDALMALVRDSHAAGLLVALGGSLGASDFRLVADTGAAIIGIRGAACSGGRNGKIERRLVQALRQSLDAAQAQAGSSARSQSPIEVSPSGPTARHLMPAGSTRLK